MLLAGRKHFFADFNQNRLPFIPEESKTKKNSLLIPYRLFCNLLFGSNISLFFRDKTFQKRWPESVIQFLADHARTATENPYSYQ